MGSPDRTNTSCWSRCIWWFTSCGGRRVPRVAPVTTFPVIQVPHLKKGASGFYNVNQSVLDSPHFESSGNTQSPNSKTDTDQLWLKNSIFFEIDNDRKLRAVHLAITASQNLCHNQSGSSEQNDVSSQSSPEKNTESAQDETANLANSSTKQGDEEDEYWFSKWTRKPRFRSIFEKNTIHCGTETDEDGNVPQDLALAKAVATAKRHVWAYNNGNVVQLSEIVDTNEDEYNSIDILESSQRWSKTGGSPSQTNNAKPSDPGANEGITNEGFQSDDDPGATNNGEHIAEISVESVQISMNEDSSSSPPNASNEHTQPNVQESSAKGIDKPALIFFIHGISSSSEIWKSQMQHFHGIGYECVAVDLLGHGFSSTPTSAKLYHFETLVQDVLNIYDYFVEENRKTVVVGHGYGSCIASVIAKVRPKSCTVLVSVSGGGPTPLLSRTCCRGSVIPFYCTLFHRDKRKGRFDNPEFRHVLPPYVHTFYMKGQIWGDGDSAFYRRITVPTLLVYGMKDKIINLVEECEMERTMPKSFLEIIDCAGHMVMLDEPKKLNKMLQKFVQSWV